MTSAPFVTIGVPVYRDELFIEETLRSIQNQTHKNIEVIISLDGPQPVVEERCQPFLKDSRFHVFVQPERLGWVGNVNWLMKHVETPYWYLHPYDDLTDSHYVEVLLSHAQQTPEAAVVYCDIATFGLQSTRIVQPSVVGGPVSRQLILLHEHLAAVAFRGLTRLEALRNSGDIRANDVESFATDTVWMAAMARSGELLRVPLELYHKRYHPANVHTKWPTWPAEKITKAWIIHCADMLEQAMLVDALAQERRLLWLTAVTRLSSPRFPYISIAGVQAKEYRLLLDGFLEYIKTAKRMDIPTLLEDNWRSIYKWTRDFYIHEKRFFF